MRKVKGKVELRYYEIPQNEFLFTLQGDAWRRVYEYRDGLLHFHNLMEIGICLEGDGYMSLENDNVPYRPGIITVIPENYPHGTISTNESLNYWNYLFVDVDRVVQAMFPDNVLLQMEVKGRINRSAFLFEEKDVFALSMTARAILEETEQKKEYLHHECVDGLAEALMVQIARIQAGGESFSAEMNIRQKTGFAQMLPSLEFIRTNYPLPIKVSEIAAECHMSESHFRRLFEENIGMTPVEYLNRFRILQACNLIQNSGSTMEEIAAKVGYTTTSTFNRNFKRVTGTSPYQWKKQPDNYMSRLSESDVMVENGWE